MTLAEKLRKEGEKKGKIEGLKEAIERGFLSGCR